MGLGGPADSELGLNIIIHRSAAIGLWGINSLEVPFGFTKTRSQPIGSLLDGSRSPGPLPGLSQDVSGARRRDCSPPTTACCAVSAIARKARRSFGSSQPCSERLQKRRNM